MLSQNVSTVRSRVKNVIKHFVSTIEVRQVNSSLTIFADWGNLMVS